MLQRADALLFVLRRFRLMAASAFPDFASAGGAAKRKACDLAVFFTWGDKAKKAGLQLDYVLVSCAIPFTADVCPTDITQSDHRVAWACLLPPLFAAQAGYFLCEHEGLEAGGR